MKTLGVIGGLGPAATALFMEMVIEMTQAKTDQEHIHMLVDCCPQVPDRTEYILGRSPQSPAPYIIDMGKNLAKAGAGLIAVTCITSSYFYSEFEREIPVPVINMITELKEVLRKAGIKSAGLMATSGTIASGLFQKAFEESGMRLILPPDELQADVMHVIYENIKAGKPAEMDRFNKVSDALRKDGAEVIILGCTELSVVKRNEKLKGPYLDALEVMARKAVKECADLKAEYEDLI